MVASNDQEGEEPATPCSGQIQKREVFVLAHSPKRCDTCDVDEKRY